MTQMLINAGINMADLDNAFKLMGVGMLGIFIVMAVISLIVFVSTKLPSKKQ